MTNSVKRLFAAARPQPRIKQFRELPKGLTEVTPADMWVAEQELPLQLSVLFPNPKERNSCVMQSASL